MERENNLQSVLSWNCKVFTCVRNLNKKNYFKIEKRTCEFYISSRYISHSPPHLISLSFLRNKQIIIVIESRYFALFYERVKKYRFKRILLNFWRHIYGKMIRSIIFKSSRNMEYFRIAFWFMHAQLSQVFIRRYLHMANTIILKKKINDASFSLPIIT